MIKSTIKSLLTFTKTLNKEIIFITDGAGWAIDNVSYGLSGALSAKRIRSTVIKSNGLRYLPLIRGKVVCFIDRWAYLDMGKNNFLKQLSKSNKIIATWWHSAGDERNKELIESTDVLKALSVYFKAISVPCTLERDLLVSRGIPFDRIQVIPEGIESMFKPFGLKEKELSRRQLSIPIDVFCIGSFQKDGIGWDSGDVPKMEKGPDIFVETIKKIAKKNKKIFVVLSGPARGYVKKELEQAEIPFFHSYFADYREIANLYKTIDLYLITSRTEGGPKSVLESFACGIPVVSTRVGMCRDIIEDNVNGFLCEIEDVDGLATKVDALISDQQLNEKVTANGLKTAKEYSWNKIADIFIKKIINF